MTIRRWKPQVNDRVKYQGQRATVIAVHARKLMIRDVYGYQREVPKKECEPWHE
jgi:hypothetical protein